MILKELDAQLKLIKQPIVTICRKIEKEPTINPEIAKELRNTVIQIELAEGIIEKHNVSSLDISNVLEILKKALKIVLMLKSIFL